MLQKATLKVHEPISDQAKGSVLFVTAVRLRRGPRGLQLDDQTSAGLVRHAENFRQVKFAGIVLEGDREENTSTTWIDVVDLPCYGQLKFIELPFAYKAKDFARTYRKTRALLKEEIRSADHLCFTVGYLIGDWGAIAALESNAQGRKFAIWFDRVEHDVILRTLSAHRLRRRIKERATLPLMKWYHRYLIGRSTLGLFQGRDTYDTYSGASSNPHCMYDVHTQEADQIDEHTLDQKIERILSLAPIRVSYVGRAAPMKGPEDWVSALAIAAQGNPSIEACWTGDGPLLDVMEEMIQKNHLQDKVKLAGYVGDREALLQALRDSDIFVFCHKTAESPRCLIEALVCGSALIGYHSPYAEDLVSEHGGGALVSRDDIEALGRQITELNNDRAKLAQLVSAAAISGKRFDEKSIYQRRATLLKSYA
jgi:glycosyltransferase involved in cell wall biosynthesis